MEKETKLALTDMLMNTNPYDTGFKELLKASLIDSKNKEGYLHLNLIEYLDLKCMLEEMEL